MFYVARPPLRTPFVAITPPRRCSNPLIIPIDLRGLVIKGSDVFTILLCVAGQRGHCHYQVAFGVDVLLPSVQFNTNTRLPLISTQTPRRLSVLRCLLSSGQLND